LWKGYEIFMHGKGVWVIISLLGLMGCKTRNTSRVNAENKISQVSAPTGEGLDVSDVSILFPMGLTEKEKKNYLGFSDLGFEGQPLFPKKMFDAIKAMAISEGTHMDFVGPNSDSVPRDAGKYENWKILGFRFDPCSTNKNHLEILERGSISDQDNCLLLLRLVAQPVSFGPQRDRFRPDAFLEEKLGVEDLTIHLIYSVKPEIQKETLREVAGDLLALKKASPVSTSFVPLGVHPGLAKEEMKGSAPFTQQTKAFILKYMGASRLKKVAFMGIKETDPWIFFGASLSPDGNLKREPIFGGHSVQQIDDKGVFKPKPVMPNIQAEGMVEHFRELHELRDKFTTFSESGAIVPELTDPRLAPVVKKTMEDSKAMEAALRVLNPSQVTQAEGDCVSCHLASPSLLKFETEFLKKTVENPNRFPFLNGVTGFASSRVLSDDPPGSYIIRNFGFMDASPAISFRAVNESAIVAKMINKLVLNLPDPAVRLDTCNEAELHFCILNSGGNACFQKFKCR